MTRHHTAEVKRELRRRVLTELRARGADVFKATVRAQILESLHEKQTGIINAIALGIRYFSLCCSRRAGKTNLLAKLIVLTLLEAGHNQAVFYIAQTLKIGKGLIWPEVERLIKSYDLEKHLGWKLRENTGEVVTDAGAHFFIVGLNKQGQVNVSRGFDAVLFLIDETQEYEHLLAPTLTAVGPALSGRKGVFIAAGTPGYVPAGTWFDWAHGTDGFNPYAWTVLDNPKNPRPGQEVIDEEKRNRGWDDNHPELLREWYGKWVADHSRLCAEFIAERNSCRDEHGALGLPEDYGPHWRHVVGIDPGFNDSFAWVVVAKDPHSDRCIVVHAESHTKLLGEEPVEITKRIVEAYGTNLVVCDYSAGGKQFYETFNATYGAKMGCYIRNAKKMDKAGRVRFLNTLLRTGKLSVHRADEEGDNGELVVPELMQLRWKDQERTQVLTSEKMRDDLFDCLLYCIVEVSPWKPRKREAAAQNDQKDAAKAWAEKVKTDPEARRIEERNQKVRAERQQGPLAGLFGKAG